MLAVTERAKERLKSMLTSKVENPQAALRLAPTEEGQFGLRVDVETSDDEVVEHDGITVLVVEKELASRMDGITLDVQDTPNGPEFTAYMENPE